MHLMYLFFTSIFRLKVRDSHGTVLLMEEGIWDGHLSSAVIRSLRSVPTSKVTYKSSSDSDRLGDDIREIWGLR